MRFYKRNPKIKETVFVCGKAFEEDTVVFGDEFAPFADPNTFPGIEPRLVECQMGEIQGDKLAKLKEYESDKVPERPRHSGGTTTANFHMGDEGARIDIVAPIRTAVAPSPVPQATQQEPSQEPSAVDEAKAPQRKSLSEMFEPVAMAEACPGVNASSAAKIIAKFKWPQDLANASNVDLRATGVRSNYFSKVRAWAKELN